MKRKLLIIMILSCVLLSSCAEAGPYGFDGTMFSPSQIWAQRISNAIATGNVEKTRRLAENRIFDIDTVFHVTGQTPLQMACLHGEFEAIKILVENGADVNLGDEGYNRPLDILLEDFHQSDKEAMLYLYENGADFSANEFSSPLCLIGNMWAGKEDWCEERTDYSEVRGKEITELFKTALDICEDETACDYNGELLLGNAATGGNLDLMKYIMYDLGIDTNQTDENGCTALFYIDDYGMTKAWVESIVNLLVENGIDINHKNDYGETAYDYAIIEEYPILAELVEL